MITTFLFVTPTHRMRSIMDCICPHCSHPCSCAPQQPPFLPTRYPRPPGRLSAGRRFSIRSSSRLEYFQCFPPRQTQLAELQEPLLLVPCSLHLPGELSLCVSPERIFQCSSWDNHRTGFWHFDQNEFSNVFSKCRSFGNTFDKTHTGDSSLHRACEHLLCVSPERIFQCSSWDNHRIELSGQNEFANVSTECRRF